MKWTGSVLVQEKMVFPKQFTGFPDIVHMIQFFCTPLLMIPHIIRTENKAYQSVAGINNLAVVIQTTTAVAKVTGNSDGRILE